MWKTFISLEIDHLETRAISDEARILPFELGALNRLVIYRYENSKRRYVVWERE